MFSDEVRGLHLPTPMGKQISKTITAAP